MSVGLWRRAVVVSVAVVGVGAVALAAFAEGNGGKFHYKQIPSDVNTMGTIKSDPDPSLVVRRQMNAHSGPVVLDGTFTPSLTNTATSVKLTWKTPKHSSIVFQTTRDDAMQLTSITSISASLTGTLDCTDQPTDGTPGQPFTALVGKVSITYLAADASGHHYKSMAAVRLGPGHDATKTDDVAFSGIVTGGVGLGESFILDGIMRPVTGSEWAACQAGTASVTKMSFATDVDVDDDGVPTPGFYHGGLAFGYGATDIDGWNVGGRP